MYIKAGDDKKKNQVITTITRIQVQNFKLRWGFGGSFHGSLYFWKIFLV
jgi:hypothetical protein